MARPHLLTPTCHVARTNWGQEVQLQDQAAEGAHSGEASMNVDPEALSATASTSTMILGCPIV